MKLYDISSLSFALTVTFENYLPLQVKPYYVMNDGTLTPSTYYYSAW